MKGCIHNSLSYVFDFYNLLTFIVGREGSCSLRTNKKTTIKVVKHK